MEDNKKLEEKISSLEYENYDYKRKYNDLKEKTDYLIYHLSKIINILPKILLIDYLFIIILVFNFLNNNMIQKY